MILVGRIVKDDWSKSQADTLELKTDAMLAFETNSGAVIAEAALRVVVEARNRVVVVRERRRDAVRELVNGSRAIPVYLANDPEAIFEAMIDELESKPVIGPIGQRQSGHLPVIVRFQ